MSVLFKNFGKSTKDLFKKKYDFDNQLKVVNKNAGNAEVETGVVQQGCGGELRGYLKGSKKCPKFGATDVEVHTDVNQESKVTWKLSQLASGLTVTPSFSSREKAFNKKPAATVDVEYVQPNVAASVTAKSDLESHKLDASLTVSREGLSVGGSAAVDATNGFKVGDINFGVQYSQKEYTASLFTENNRDALNLSYNLKVNASQEVGAAVRADFVKGVRTMQVGIAHKIDEATSVKSKLDLSSANPGAATASFAVEHRLANPALLLSVASAYKIGGKACESCDFGVQVTLGDF